MPMDDETQLSGMIETLEQKLAEMKQSLVSMVDERTHQLERAKKEWEETFDAINDPVLILDQEYRVIRANLALARAVGKDIRALIGQPCYESLMAREQVCEGCPLAATLQNNVGTEAEVHQMDSEKWYHVRSFPLSGAQTVVHEYRDITEEKNMQRMLIQAEKLSSIGLLAGRVAHEINNPLAAILAQTQLLLMDTQPGHENHEALREVEKAALRCRRIVQDLLNFSRQKPSNLRGRHAIRPVMEQALTLYSLIPPKDGPTLHVQWEEPLPEIRMDPEPMQSVLLNLLSNAKSATPSTGEIHVRVWLASDEILLSIRDTGDGIPVEWQEKIFMPFFTTKPPGLGTGLGLYIVQEIIKEHGGRIELFSQPGEGTEFCVHLPVR